MAARSVPLQVLTYYGIDGAAAAAAALLRHPEAPLAVASQRTVGAVLERIAGAPPRALHICGLGVACEWRQVAAALAALTAAGTEVFWHCGRGYLDAERERFAAVCEPVFVPAASNTEAVARYFDVLAEAAAPLILQVALQDPRLARGDGDESAGALFWRDFIQAAISEWFKYNDPAPYGRAVRRLAALDYDRTDEQRVEVYRRSGHQYVLHGKSVAMRQLRQQIARVAEADLPVLIAGESGVGKEHVAHLIHERSRRCTERLVAVNCATFAGNAGLANSMLFGHLQGAFTGAIADREGAFAAAHGGILFLDEFGDLSLEVQAKLLRVLESQEVVPEGSDGPPRQVDVRVVVATHRDLPAMIRAGTFRADLYHRVSTLRLAIPPLREHASDIPEILAMTGPGAALSAAELEALKAYPWPGNVRQLLKLVQRARHMGLAVREALVEEAALGPLVPEAATGTDPFLPRCPAEVRPIDEVIRTYAAGALALFDGNKTATAKALGVAPNTLRRHLDD